MPLSAIAGVVGMSFLAAGWKFVWAPLGDYTLSRKRWYLLAVAMISLGLVTLTTLPLTPHTLPLVSLLVLLTSVAGTFLAFATEGLMVHNTPGSLGPEWRAPADTVSAVLGLGGGVAIVAGCFAGGRLADHLHKPTAYALSCGLGLAACVLIALSPRTAGGYAATTLFYTFTLGMVAASYTGLVLAIVGHTAVATKINLFFAINSLFSLGMLRGDGWAHDALGTNGMLYTEALVGVVALAIFAAVVSRVPGGTLVLDGDGAASVASPARH